jgi:hypothetical protein
LIISTSSNWLTSKMSLAFGKDDGIMWGHVHGVQYSHLTHLVNLVFNLILLHRLGWVHWRHGTNFSHASQAQISSENCLSWAIWNF